MEVDPAASMRVWAVELELGDRTYEVPPMPAADWYDLLVDGNLLGLLDLIEDDDLTEAILAGRVTSDELTEKLGQVVEHAAGRPLGAALALLQAARVTWSVIGGELARGGFRWDQAPLGAALDAVYTTVMAALKPEGRRRFQALLDSEAGAPARPGPGGRRRRVNRDRAMADFETMAGPRPSPATAAPSAGGRPRTPRRPRPHPRAAR